ncbi:hypothetical protein JAAARDRAFT_192202 [Jaapia argillacea MUCL 33604]|uniref:Uncharacterized protein n=1 Tax=Jaapia argillacea MUCL 33604 TaxID=933084 RepID=A0A067PYD6_9AGAM|nr:hypothetical protein JAAARDRAFT_192202 [Jaapia argillacea MUCL 33604]
MASSECDSRIDPRILEVDVIARDWLREIVDGSLRLPDHPSVADMIEAYGRLLNSSISHSPPTYPMRVSLEEATVGHRPLTCKQARQRIIRAEEIIAGASECIRALRETGFIRSVERLGPQPVYPNVDPSRLPAVVMGAKDIIEECSHIGRGEHGWVYVKNLALRHAVLAAPRFCLYLGDAASGHRAQGVYAAEIWHSHPLMGPEFSRLNQTVLFLHFISYLRNAHDIPLFVSLDLASQVQDGIVEQLSRIQYSGER